MFNTELIKIALNKIKKIFFFLIILIILKIKKKIKKMGCS
jgi:hypothetical protein